MPSAQVGKKQRDARFPLGADDSSGISVPKGGFLPKGDSIQISPPGAIALYPSGGKHLQHKKQWKSSGICGRG